MTNLQAVYVVWVLVLPSRLEDSNGSLLEQVFFETTHEKLHYLVISDPRALLSSIH